MKLHVFPVAPVIKALEKRDGTLDFRRPLDGTDSFLVLIEPFCGGVRTPAPPGLQKDVPTFAARSEHAIRLGVLTSFITKAGCRKLQRDSNYI